jgi:hypothetical protein
VSKGVKIRDTDRGYKELLSRVYKLRQPPSIAVGILATNASKSDGLATVLDIATFNEFGTVKDGKTHVPARPFIRGWFDEHRDEAIKRLTNLLKEVVAGRLTEDAALNRFGLWAQTGIQKTVSEGVPPPNAESTVRRKGSSTPLIDTGVMRSSVSFEIRRK